MQKVISQNKTTPEITVLYEHPGGCGWTVERSAPDGVSQVFIHKGVQVNDPTKPDVQTMDDAESFYNAKKNSTRDIFQMTVRITKRDDKGNSLGTEDCERIIKEGEVLDESGTIASDAITVKNVIELNPDNEVIDIQTATEKIISMNIVQSRTKQQAQMEE
jgi:hypothetical protein